ncbi:MAG: 5-formyltetrahydrofolate cyclo-ligase [Minisyncoccia bacterium]
MLHTGKIDAGEELSRLLSPYGAMITYVPLRGEVPFLDYGTLPSTALLYQIPPRASLDPKEEAEKARTLIRDHSAAILIPGRRFDALGARQGQGGGWYDRFLALVPHEWFRIGFCYDRQFSLSPLARQPWDQGVDAVCVIGEHGARVYHAKRV